MTTFLSSAFLQQCFAMHRNDLAVKRLNQSGMVVACRACRIRHAVRLASWDSTESGPADPPEVLVAEPLATCAADHLASVYVRAVDVQRDFSELSCRQCRAAQPFRIIECVTRALASSSGL